MRRSSNASIVATVPSDQPRQFPIGGDAHTVTLQLSAPPGVSTITLASTARPVGSGTAVASALEIADLRASTAAGVNVASTQQFAAASPVPSR